MPPGVIQSCIPITLHIISATFIATLCFQLLKTLYRSWRPETTPPGSTGLPLLGETLSFLWANNSNKGLYEFIRVRRQRYGNCFKTNIFGKINVFISSLEAAKSIFGDHSECFTERCLIGSISKLLGKQSLLCTSGNLHKFLRNHIGSQLNSDLLASCIRLFDNLTIQVQSSWKNKETIVVLDDALKITFSALCQMLMSMKREEELESLQQDVFLLCEAMVAIPLNFPGSRFSKGLQARKRIMNKLKEIIEKRRKGQEKHEDFLQEILMKDNYKNASSLTDAQIQDNLLTLIVAGQVTTASAIAWMVKYLDENQEVQQNLRDEQLPLSTRTEGSFLQMHTLNNMPYALKVVKETLRLASIVSWFPVVTLRDCEIEGFHIKKDWVVNVDVKYIHSDQNVYENPTQFSPMRFNEDPKPYSFLAFGTGGTSCLGMNLAKAMMLVFLHHLVTTYRWKVMDPDKSLVENMIFPRLKSGCPISVTPLNNPGVTLES